MIDAQPQPALVGRPSHDRLWLLATGVGAFVLGVLSIALVAQLRAKHWLGEGSDGGLVATHLRLWVNRGVQGAALLGLGAIGITLLQRARGRLDPRSRAVGVAVAIGAVVAVPAAYGAMGLGNQLGATYLLDGPTRNAQPAAAPAVARLLFQPTTGLPAPPLPATPSSCARSDGATVAARIAGRTDALLVVEGVVLFPDDAHARLYYAGRGCPTATSSSGVRTTAAALPAVAGVGAANASSYTAGVGTSHPFTNVRLRMRVGPAVIVAYANLFDVGPAAPSRAQVIGLERELAAAATSPGAAAG